MNKIEDGFKQIVKIQYAFESDIESTEETSGNKLTVNFTSGFTWVDLFSKLFSIEFNESSKETDSGIMYEQKLTFDIQGDKDDVNFEFYKVRSREIIMLLIYEDGTSKVIGDINNPCLLMKDFSSKPLDTLHKFYISKDDYRPALYLNS